MKKRVKDPVSEVVKLLDRVVTQAQVTQFQLKVITQRLDALEKSAAPHRQRTARR